MPDNREPGPDIFERALNLTDDESTNREPGADETTETEQTGDEDLELSLDDEEGESETTATEDKITRKIKAYGETVELDIDGLEKYAQLGLNAEKQQKKLLDEHNSRLQEVAQEREKINAEAVRLGELLEVFGQSEKAQEHLDFLMENDLPEYKRQKAMLDEVAKLAESSRKAKADAEVAAGVELLSSTFPSEWADDKKRQDLLGEAADVFKDVGIDIRTVTDGKLFLMAIKANRLAEKAKKYDALVEKARTARDTPPKKLPTTTGTKAKADTSSKPFDVVAEFFGR